MRKSQSLLEYLVVLTAVVLVIVIHTFGPFGVRQAVDRALDRQQQDIQTIINRDYSGRRINNSELMRR